MPPPAPNLALTTWHNALHSIKSKERREVLKKLKHAAWEIPFPVYFSVEIPRPKPEKRDEEKYEKNGRGDVNENRGEQGVVEGKGLGSGIGVGKVERRDSVESGESVTSIEDEEGHEIYAVTVRVHAPKPEYKPEQGSVTASGNAEERGRCSRRAKKRDSVMSVESISSIEDEEGHDLYQPVPAPIPIASTVLQRKQLVTPTPTPKPKQKPKQKPKPKRILKIYLDTHTERGKEWLAKVRGETSNLSPSPSPSPARYQPLTPGNGEKGDVKDVKQESKARRVLMLLLYKLKEEVEYQAWRGGAAGKSWARLRGLEGVKKLTLRFRVRKSLELERGDEGGIQEEEETESERLGDEKKRRNGKGKRKRMISDEEEDHEFEIQNVIDRGVGKRRIVKKVKWEPAL